MMVFKALVYAILFGFIGMVGGIWFADLLYVLFLKHIDRVTTIYISLIIIVLIIVGGAIIGFTKGKDLLESNLKA